MIPAARRVLIATILAGCASQEGGPAPAMTPLSLSVDASIGGEGGGPANQFTSIAQVVARGDSVYVLQNGIPEIRVFDASRGYLHTIGRSGGGPGEFTSLEAMGLIGDTLWTIDGELRRISFFTPDGSLLSTMPYEPIPPTFGDGRTSFFPYFRTLAADGSVYGFGGSAGRDIASGAVTATPLLRMARSGQTLDTLGWVPIGNEHLILRSGRSNSYRSQPFGDAPLTVYAPDVQRIYVVERPAASVGGVADVTITALESNGDTAWVSALPYTPARLDREKVDSVRAAFHKAFAGRYPPSEVDRALYVPAFRTPITGAIAATDGALWLRWDDATSPGMISVVGPDGRLRGEAAAVPRLRLKWVSGDMMWAETLDDNDVPTLVRYRLSSEQRK